MNSSWSRLFLILSIVAVAAFGAILAFAHLSYREVVPQALRYEIGMCRITADWVEIYGDKPGIEDFAASQHAALADCRAEGLL